MFFDRRLGMPMRIGSRGTARPRWRRFFAGEHEALPGEYFSLPLSLPSMILGLGFHRVGMLLMREFLFLL
jgi:hypothetical protein